MTTPQPPTPLWQTRKFRIAALASVVGLLVLILILQNFDRIYVQFFFWEARIPIAVVIFISMVVGAGLEVLVRILLRRRKRRRETARQAANPPEGKAELVAD